jgi:hypothetical protein
MKLEALRNTSEILSKKTERISRENDSIQIKIQDIEDLIIKESKARFEWTD